MSCHPLRQQPIVAKSYPPGTAELVQRYAFLPMPTNILAIFRKFRTNGRFAFKYAILTGLSTLKTVILGLFCSVLAAVRCHARLTVQSGETRKYGMNLIFLSVSPVRQYERTPLLLAGYPRTAGQHGRFPAADDPGRTA